MINPLETLWCFRRLMRSQWLDREALRLHQDELLRRMVRHAYATVPYYRRRFDEAGVDPASIRGVADLPRVPLTTKADLQQAGMDAIVSSAVPATSLVTEATTGSSGRPLPVQCEPSWLAMRQAMFLRALISAGYRPGRRAVLLTSGERKPPPAWFRWHYLPYKDPSATILQQVNRIRPFMLYGWVTPLRQLADHVLATGALVHRAPLLVTTAEGVDAATRALFERVLAHRAVQIYGLTEMGAVGIPCPMGHGYHLAEDVAAVELLDAHGEGKVKRLVMTNLHLRAMPFIRYEVGDLAAPGEARRCACGRWLMRIERVEGRMVDCVQMPDGRQILPYRFTTAIEQVPGLGRYQLIQEDFQRFVVGYEADRSAGSNGEATAEAIRRVVAAIVGDDARIDVVRRDSLDPSPGRKFRVVESRLRAATTEDDA